MLESCSRQSTTSQGATLRVFKLRREFCFLFSLFDDFVGCSSNYAKNFPQLAVVAGSASCIPETSKLPEASKISTGHRKQQQQKQRSSPRRLQLSTSHHATAAVHNLLAASSDINLSAPHRSIDLATAPASGAQR
jgi:hypothetical protein